MTSSEIKPPKTCIKITDTEAMRDYLDAVNGRAVSFVATPRELQAFADRAETRLEKAGLPRARRVGVIVRARTAGPSAKAYQYSVIGNEVELKGFREG